MTKILCLGFDKTGTTSLHEAFKWLGFSSAHCEWEGDVRGGDLVTKAAREHLPLLVYMPGVQAYSDMELYDWYQTLAEQYPEAYYILNTREPYARAVSKIKHDMRWNARFPERQPRRVDEQRKHELVALQCAREEDIRAYFKGWQRFTEFNVTEGDGYPKLCEFLGLPSLDEPFPFENKGS